MKPYLFLHIPKTAGSSVAECLPSGRTTIPHFLTENKDNNDLCAFGFDGPRHHYTFEQYTKIGVEIPEKIYKFAFVRNPWDRVVSMFHHWQKLNTKYTNYQSKLTGETVTVREEFPDSVFGSFVSSTLYEAMQDNITEYKPKITYNGETLKGTFNQPTPGCPFYYTVQYGHFTPQVKYTHDSRGKQVVDFIGRYETLQQDINKLRNILDEELPLVTLPHINQSKRLKKDYRDYYNDGTGLSKELVYEMYREDIETYNYVF